MSESRVTEVPVGGVTESIIMPLSCRLLSFEDIRPHSRILGFEQLPKGYRPFRVAREVIADPVSEVSKWLRNALQVSGEMGVGKELQDGFHIG